MARLLRDLDYRRLIQDDNLLQIIESNQQIKLDVEQAAQAEMIGYLAQRYKVSEVFSNTTEFDIAAVYKAKNLVEYTATAFSAAATYSANARVVQAGNVYKSIAGSAAHAFNASEWTLICADKTLYYAALPKEQFSIYVNYVTGDEVFYENKTYTCARNCIGILPTESTFWGAGTSYTVSATWPDDNTTKWTKGDNRNQLIVMYLIDISLYHLHSRINPRNIPDLRKDRYDGNREAMTGGAIGWLKSVAKGSVNADLPEIEPEQGLPMRWGNAGSNDVPSANQLW